MKLPDQPALVQLDQTSAALNELQQPQWLASLVQVARFGHVQLALVLASMLWTAVALSRLSRRVSLVAKSHKPPGYLTFALGSQTLLAASVISFIIAASRDDRHWPGAAAVSYAFLLSFVRAGVSPSWRRVLMHQVNFISASVLIVLSVAELLPLIVIHTSDRPDSMIVTGITLLFLSCFVAAASPREWIAPSYHTSVPKGIQLKESKEDTCSWLDYYFTFGRANALMGKGWRKTLSMGDLEHLPWYYTPEVLHTKIVELRQRHKTTLRTISIFAWKEIVASILLGGVFFASMLSSPIGLYQLLNYLANPDEATLYPYVWLLVIFVGEVLQSVTTTQFGFISGQAAIKLKTALTSDIYQRALASRELEDDFLGDATSDSSSQRPSSAGQLANLMSTDVSMVLGGRIVLMLAFGAPIGIIATFIALYKVVGWPCFVGVAIVLLGSPLPTWIIRSVGQEQEAAKKAQDSRISIASEYLGAIRVVKYFGWEDVATGFIEMARAKEQKHMWRIDVLGALMDEATSIIPSIGLLAIYGLYIGVEKQPLTAAVAFTTVRLLETVTGNFAMLSAIGMMIPRIAISLRRLDKFYDSTIPLESHTVGPLRLDIATFRRNQTADFRIQNASIDFVQGGLNIIAGQSGSGKTTLLLSILGETIKESGDITRPRDAAYASQTPWLQSQSIRDNILFNAPFDADRYHAIIHACCLGPDLDELPDGDKTQVGEKGATISGGQRARVALASVLYSNASLVLLDNIFAAIDTKTASSLWNRVFCTDVLKGRTVVMVSHLSWVVEQADLHVTLQGGRVEASEQNIAVVRRPRAVKVNDDDEEGVTATAATGESTPLTKQPDVEEAEAKGPESSVDHEVSVGGVAGRIAFLQYMLYFGGPITLVLTILTLVLYNGLEIGTTFWMSYWVDTYAKDSSASVPFYLGIYIAISVGGNLMHSVAFLSFVRGGWRAARRLHSEVISAVMGVSLSWFTDNPVGRVINRLSGDLDSLDQMTARQVMAFLDKAFKIIMQTGAVSSILPVFTIPAAVVTVAATICGEIYHRTATIVKRLVSSTHSPILSQISESLTGLTVIRSQSGMPQLFSQQLNQRLHASACAAAAQRECDTWLKVRINTLAAFVDISAGLIALSMRNSPAAGLVGFSLVTAGMVSNAILYIVHDMNSLGVEMQSFHRIKEYCTLSPEEAVPEKTADESSYRDEPEYSIPKNWPRSGRVEFRNVNIRYDSNGPDILKDVSLVFEANERVAIVGRTGSGKSTLILSLLRFTHIVSGTILYDGVDISAISRKKLRHAITTIPQEAILFQGTIGSNLDPAGEAEPAQLQQALYSCSSIAAMQLSGSSSPSRSNTEELGPETAHSLSLSTLVQSGGSNFSHGQRQVLSLCRALVRKSKLMLLDEATSNMDHVTDVKIQEILRDELNSGGKNRCLVTIAHRLRTITDYDKVVVMGSGRVLEVGSPQALMQKRGVFYDMVQHSGEQDIMS